MKRKTKKFERHYPVFLVNKLLDDTSRLMDLHLLIEITSDQLNYQEANIVTRLQLLIDAYLTEARPLVEQITQTAQTLQNLPPTNRDSQDTM